MMRLLRNRQRNHPEELHGSGVGQEGQGYRDCVQFIGRLRDERIGKVVQHPEGDQTLEVIEEKRVNLVRPERFELPTYCSGGCLYTVALREINEL